MLGPVIQVKIYAFIFLNIEIESNNYNFASNFLLQVFQISVFCIKQINESVRNNVCITTEMQTERKCSIIAFVLTAKRDAFTKICLVTSLEDGDPSHCWAVIFFTEKIVFTLLPGKIS